MKLEVFPSLIDHVLYAVIACNFPYTTAPQDVNQDQLQGTDSTHSRFGHRQDAPVTKVGGIKEHLDMEQQGFGRPPRNSSCRYEL